jgi:pilus assembly protein FimV
MKRKPALLLALSLYSVPPSVSALGLGDIELRSSLNQPLDARIALKSWRPGELEDLKVNLAGREHFDRAGMERIAGLSDL